MGFLTNNSVRAVVVLTVCIIFVQTGWSSSGDTAKKSIFGQKSLFQEDEKSESLDHEMGSAIYRMIVGVLIVVLLGLAAMYVSKRVLPKFSNIQGKKIKVVETVHLGSRKTLHLVEIAEQQILIGSTPDRITKLADIFSEKGFPLHQPDNREESA